MTRLMPVASRLCAAVVLGAIAVLAVESGLALRGTDPDLPRPLVPTRPDGAPLSAAELKARIARDPVDYGSLIGLALALERDKRREEATTAMRAALALAPADRRALIQAAEVLARAGSEAESLAVLRRVADLYPATWRALWPAFVAALDTPAYREWFDDVARSDPRWWPEFFEFACANATLGPVRAAYLVRTGAALATEPEQRCLIARLQRERDWSGAYRLWLASLPAAERPSQPGVFNGDFERPLSGIGFDWIVPGQPGIAVETSPARGANGRYALDVQFVDKRWASWPLYQYLLLSPGRHRLEGRARPDGLETWLGLQWAVYCVDAAGKDIRQLAHTESFQGRSEWRDFQAEVAVPRDCPLQILRLELANPDATARTAGSAPVRLNGRIAFDDLRIVATE